MSLSNLDKAKLSILNQINIDTTSESIKNVGLDGLRSLLISKEQELQDKFLTAILKIMQDAGIDITTTPPKLPNLCPTKEVLDKIIIIRNNLITDLNRLNNTLNVVSKTVAVNNKIFEIASKLPQIIGAIKTALSLGIKFIPSPPGAPGAVTSALSDLGDLKNLLLFNADGSAKLVESKNKIEMLSLAIDTFSVIVTKIISLLELLDQLINKCTKTNLISIDNDLIQQTKRPTAATQTSYQGFTIKIVEVPFNAKISKRKAVGYNIEGIPLIETPASFTTNPQILIDELKLYIDNNNLKAY